MPSTSEIKLLVLTSLFTALTAMGAHTRVPLPLIPFSLQTFFVMLSGCVLGPRHGALSQLAYVALGLAGLPLFTKGGGPAYVLQPTFGYLLAFPVASFMAGTVIHGIHPRPTVMPVASWRRLVLANSTATLTILAMGVGYLWLNVNWLIGRELTMMQALYAGALIFLPADVLKILGVTILYGVLQRRLNTWRTQQNSFAPLLEGERTS